MGDPQEGKGIDSMNVSYARGPVWGPHHRSVYRSHSTDGGTETPGGEVFSPLLLPSLETFHTVSAHFFSSGHLVESDKGKTFFSVLILLPIP